MKVTPPWWVLLAGASFLTYFFLLVYCDSVKPQWIGIHPDFRSGSMVVRAVLPGSAAAEAGLLAGARILLADGRPVRTPLDWAVVESNIQFDRPLVLTLADPAGGRVAIPVRRQTGDVVTAIGPVLLAVRAIQLCTLGIALLVAFARPRDPTALIGALVLGTLAVFSVLLPFRVASVWRALPHVLQVLAIPPFILSACLGALLFAFFVSFPRPTLMRSWRAWAVAFAPMGILATWRSLYGLSLALWRTGMPDWSQWLFLVNVAYLAVGFVLFVHNSRRLRDMNDRRRARVVLAGCLATCLAGAPLVGRYWFGGADADLSQSMFASPGAAIGALMILCLPASFAYAILKHRLFGLRLMVRQGLQYALARRFLLAIAPALAALLAADLLIHGDDPLLDVLYGRGWLYGLAGGLALLAHARREAWMAALDRRFFRDRYDAERLLRETVEEVRRVADLDRIAPRVVSQVVGALHVRFAALLTKPPGEQTFTCLAAVPAGRAIEPIVGQSTVIELARVLKHPIDLSRVPGWLERQMLQAEARQLVSHDVQVLAPVALDGPGLQVLLLVGSKMSEEPFSQDDLNLLGAIGDSLALLVERAPTGAGETVTSFEECPVCGTCFDTGTGRCPKDAAALARSPLPRALAARYVLQQRLGSGGMGAVYEAVDGSLGRRVAVKVLREELTRSAEAQERFRREARLAASITHPNVVIVHDFGVADCARAFLVMELLRGRTLREELQAAGALAPARVLQVMHSICGAVEAAHRQHVVHRDLKPENVFLATSEAGEVVKVLDFGIARAVETAPTGVFESAPGRLVGTYRYMAPEQLRNDPVHVSWDLWALAVMGFEMLVGRHPYSTPDREGSLLLPVDPADLGGLAPALATFFRSALSPDPRLRPASATALYDGLKAALA